MKLKLPILTAIILFLGLSLSQAQFISLARSPSFPLSQTVALTRSGPLTVIWSGTIEYAPSVTATLVIDGASVDSYPIPGGTALDYRSRTYRSAALNPGSHSVQISVTGGSIKTDASLLVIAESEPSAGVQAALNQLTTAFQTADTNLRNSLITQINAIRDALDARVTDLEARIAALENGDPPPQGEDPFEAIADLQSQLDTLRQQQADMRDELMGLISELATQISDLEHRVFDTEGDSIVTRIAALQAQIEALQQQIALLEENPPGEDPSDPSPTTNSLFYYRNTFVNQNWSQVSIHNPSVVNTSTNTRSPISRHEEQGLETTDYLIIGGSAAGATALGIGIYSIFDDDSEDAEDSSHAVPAKNENRPGYGKK